VKAECSIGYSYHEIVNFRIPGGGSRAKSRATAMDFRKGDIKLFRDLLGRIPWDLILERRKIQVSQLIFKDNLFQAQGRSIQTSRKSSKHGRRPAWMCKDLLTEI